MSLVKKVYEKIKKENESFFILKQNEKKLKKELKEITDKKLQLNDELFSLTFSSNEVKNLDEKLNTVFKKFFPNSSVKNMKNTYKEICYYKKFSFDLKNVDIDYLFESITKIFIEFGITESKYIGKKSDISLNYCCYNNSLRLKEGKLILGIEREENVMDFFKDVYKWCEKHNKEFEITFSL